MDEKGEYKKSVHAILKNRIEIFYKNLDLPTPREEGNTYYYTLLDLVAIAQKKYGPDFAEFLKTRPVLSFFFDLAEKKYTIALPGYGFHGPSWSLRVSLANLDDDDYAQAGKNIKDLLESYYLSWKELS